jgi:hypothetical protein
MLRHVQGVILCERTEFNKKLGLCSVCEAVVFCKHSVTSPHQVSQQKLENAIRIIPVWNMCLIFYLFMSSLFH